jgi:quercetin dioxygenase-like cupin family protein
MTDFKARVIPDLAHLAFEDKHIKARKALVQQTDDVQMNVYVLQPGGRIPAHQHSRSWDISYVVAGRLESCYVEGGQSCRVVCQAGTVTLIPPGTVHEVTNPSETDAVTFLLIQSPAKDFDFLRAALPE